MATLVHLKKDGQRQRFTLSDRPAQIGRADGSDIQLDEPLVSRVHARIEKRGDNWVLQDLDSRNFTRVNGERIHERQLSHGDEILFARARCFFLAGNMDESDREFIKIDGVGGLFADQP